MSFQCPPPLRLRGQAPVDPPRCVVCKAVIDRGAGCVVLDTDLYLHPDCQDERFTDEEKRQWERK